jgi:hypothetical protein
MITLALRHHVPPRARRGMSGWIYAGDDPSFELSDLDRVVSADAKMEAARALREPYLDAIGGLSRQNASPTWWASYLGAKQPYPSLYDRLCELAAVRELASDGTLVVCSTLAQLQELRLMLAGSRSAGAGFGQVRRRAPATALRLVWPAVRTFADSGPGVLRAAVARAGARARFAIQRTPGHRRQLLQALGARPLPPLAGPQTALLVTWIDGRSFGPAGDYRDPHLGPLAGLLADEGLHVAQVVKPLLHGPLEATARALLASGEAAAFSDLYISAAEWRSCEQLVRSQPPAIPSDLSVGGLRFAALAREYDREHTRAQVEALSHAALVENLAASGVRPELLVFPWEGHPWELVLIDAVRRHMPATKVVGYDNLNFSTLALSLYPSDLELDLRPLPDRVVTNGSTFARVLRDNGFPDERIRVGCALRQEGLVLRDRGNRDGGGFVLAAGSIDAAETIELVRKGFAAFGRDLVVRLHPASDARAVRAALPGALRYSDEPLSDLLGRSDLMLYTYSATPYEALAAAVPPVFVRSETMLDLDQLEPTPEVRWVARTPDELKAVAHEIRSMPDRAAWERSAHQVVRAAFAPVGPQCVEAFLCRG